MCQHVSSISRVCLNHLRRLRAVCQQLDCDTAVRIVATLVLVRLDYCNALLTGLLYPMQRTMNAAARLVCGLPP